MSTIYKNNQNQNWSLQSPHLSENEIKIQKITENATGHRFPTLSKKFASLFSLYQFFVRNLDTDPKLLQKHITDNGQPIFTVSDIKQIQATIRRQQTHPMSADNVRRITSQIKKEYAPLLNMNNMKGGASNVPTAKTVSVGTPPIFSLRDPTSTQYNPNDDMLGEPNRADHIDESRNTFFDRIFFKLGNMYNNSPFALKFSHKWDGIFWFMFILYNLENADFVGPILSTALDSYNLGVRMAADLINESVPGLLSTFASIMPGGAIAGGLMGEAIATVLSGCLLMSSVIVSISRKHFGDAFKSTLEMIPVIGDFLLLFAISAESNLDRLNAYRNKIVRQLEDISPRLYYFVDYWVPKLEPVPPGPAPSAPSFDEIKDDIINSNEQLSQAMSIVQNPTAALTAQLPNSLKNLAANPLGAAAAQLPSSITNIAANPLGAAAAQLPSSITNIAANPTAALTAQLPAMPEMPKMPSIANALPKVPKMPNIANALPEMPKMPTMPKFNNSKVSFAPTMVRSRRGGGTRRKHKKNKRRYTNKRR